jgi:hypothetical protein
MQKSLARGGQILGGKVSDVGNKVLDTVVQANPLLAATPAYGVSDQGGPGSGWDRGQGRFEFGQRQDAGPGCGFAA